MKAKIRVLIALSLALCMTQLAFAQELPTVRVVKAEIRSFEKVFNFTADAVAFKTVDIYSRVQNRILKKLLADVGDRVKEGQLLAVLDDEYAKITYQSALAGVMQAEASLEQAQITAKNAEDNYLRIKELYEKKVVSKQAFDNAKAQYEQAMAGLKLAEEKLKSAKISLSEANLLLSYHRIFSPIDGVVVKKFIDEGTMVSGNTPILRLVQDNPIKVQGSLPQEALAYIKVGDEIEIYTDVYTNKAFRGKIRVISPIIDPSTRTFSIEAWIDNADYLIKVGMFLRARLSAGTRKALAIPIECVTSLNQVFVLSDGTVFERKLTLGETQNNYVEVLAGLKEGDIVVFQPTAWLKNGMKVKVVE